MTLGKTGFPQQLPEAQEIATCLEDKTVTREASTVEGNPYSPRHRRPCMELPWASQGLRVVSLGAEQSERST